MSRKTVVESFESLLQQNLVPEAVGFFTHRTRKVHAF